MNACKSHRVQLPAPFDSWRAAVTVCSHCHCQAGGHCWAATASSHSSSFYFSRSPTICLFARSQLHLVVNCIMHIYGRAPQLETPDWVTPCTLHPPLCTLHPAQCGSLAYINALSAECVSGAGTGANCDELGQRRRGWVCGWVWMSYNNVVWQWVQQ